MEKKATTILIVDDTAINRTIIMQAIKSYNYNFLEAENGVRAIELLKEHEVDLILLDILMPKMNGIEFLEWKIKEKDYVNIPVIVSSAVSEIEYIKKALSLECYDYFNKPIKTIDLHVQLPLKIKNAIKYYHTLKKLQEALKNNKNFL